MKRIQLYLAQCHTMNLYFFYICIDVHLTFHPDTINIMEIVLLFIAHRYYAVKEVCFDNVLDKHLFCCNVEKYKKSYYL